MINRRVTILITIHLLHQDLLNIRRDHTSYIIHAPCYIVSWNVPIFPAWRVSELLFFDYLWERMTLDFPFVFDHCRNMSVELYIDSLIAFFTWSSLLSIPQRSSHIFTFIRNLVSLEGYCKMLAMMKKEKKIRVYINVSTFGWYW